MTDLLVITPSRGRPERLAEMVDAVVATRYLDTRVLALVDEDDPRKHDYLRAADDRLPQRALRVIHGPRGSLASWTNWAAGNVASGALFGAVGGPGVRYLASLGDDHIPRTPGWDEQLVKAIEAMDGPGWAYGSDLLQKEALPTAWVQSAELVSALGWMMVPGCEHLWVDNAVLDLGRRAGRITYLGDVVIEHMHPARDKAGWDATYAEGNSARRNLDDRAAYERWVADGLNRDADTVRALRWPA